MSCRPSFDGSVIMPRLVSDSLAQPSTFFAGTSFSGPSVKSRDAGILPGGKNTLPNSATV
ncbi:hypothetical protein B0H17DRAFT_1196142 [Mycena rosella]|uniref:Uncharacterized protein n=1 Tax=Mycena rosella TaxID=1033263 RepID=A0AAD7DED7_MYCRO|nr:hypothetical protein B0H17DRAFT_1211011 [Mycena rosella]KAJ7687454.1 hypothetical protein B0H17DRAFT_1203685 [Mycena rosella]KAJ7700158.1 hypothetical protein B0H17DRAFT_1196142 [Mycena rosella]